MWNAATEFASSVFVKRLDGNATMSQEKPILEYAAPQLFEVKFPTLIHLIVLLLTLPALALPFVGYVRYVEQISPLEAAVEFFRYTSSSSALDLRDLTMPGLFFFVGIPLALCHLRLLIFGELSRIEVWLGYIIAVLGIVPVAWYMGIFAINLFRYGSGWTVQTLLHVIGPRVLLAGVIAFGFCVVWFLGRRVSHGTRICSCLCILYTAGLLFCVAYIGINRFSLPYYLSFGYALSLPVIVGGLIELTTLSVMAFRRNNLTSTDLRG